MENRNILHCDCNSFYASVELLAYPEYWDKPVVVGGSEESRHGIVLAKNDVAKRFNIKTAETIAKAREKCPNIIVLPPHHEKYTYFSKIINEIYNHYTDLIEPFGIDESWLDVTNSYKLFAETPKELGDIIRKRVYYETGLTLSVGVSFNKIFAKLASDYKKPDATTEISKENYKDIVFPLNVEELIYVGKTTKQVLNALGVFTIGQLAQLSQKKLSERLGKHGQELYIYANGLDESPVRSYDSKREHKSIGSGNTFSRNLLGLLDIKPAVMILSEDVGLRLRKSGVYANTIQVSIKSPTFQVINRQCKILSTNITRQIYDEAIRLVINNWSLKDEIRAITITASDITEEKRAKQTSLFEIEDNSLDGENKGEKLQKALDKLSKKFGEGTVQNAMIIGSDILKNLKGDKNEGENL